MTTRLRPGEVTPVLYNHSSTPTIVGAPPQWADDSDASYAQMTSTYDGSVTTPQTAWADMAQLSVNPRSVTELVWHARVASSPPSAHQLDLVTSDGTTITSVDWPSVFGESPEWLSGTFHYGLFGTSPSGVAAHLASGCKVFARSTIPFQVIGAYTFSLYEFYIDVTHDPGRAPALRLGPRDDINGAAGGPRLRLWPPSSSRQRSNRVSGYL